MFAYYVWLFVSAERGEITMKGYRFEKSKDPAEFRFQVRFAAILGLILTAFLIYLYGIRPLQS